MQTITEQTLRESEARAPQPFELHPVDGLKSPLEGETILALIWQNAKLGVCYFEEGANALYCTQSAEDRDFTVTRMIIFQVSPTKILVSANSDEFFLKSVRDASESLPRTVIDVEESGETRAIPVCDVRLLKSTEFGLQRARDRLFDCEVPEVSTGLSMEERSVFWSSLLPIAESSEMSRAIGGLLSFLSQSKPFRDLDGSSNCLSFSTVQYFSLEGIVSIEPSVFRFLNIFDEKSAGMRSMSLFRMLDRTASVHGRRLLRLWCLRPLDDVDVLTARLRTVGFLCDPRNSGILEDIRLLAGKCGDVSRIISRFRKRAASAKDWLQLHVSIRSILQLRSICGEVSLHSSENDQGIETFKRFVRLVGGDVLSELSQTLERLVDLDQSSRYGRVCIAAGVDDELDDMKSAYSGMDEFLTRVAEEVMVSSFRSDDDAFRAVSVTFFPQLGFLIVVPRPTDGGNVAVPNEFDIQFATSSSAFFKNDIVRRLDDELGDIHAQMVDRENSLVRFVEERILQVLETLLSAGGLVSELDCFQSLATCALTHEWVMPSVVPQAGILITRGRHPLLEWELDDQFVPNDTVLVPSKSSDSYSNQSEGAPVVVVTGPNASGKSVYLQQVGLIVFLAQIGSFVPALQAEIGLVNSIWARAPGTSSDSFIDSVASVGRMLRCATRRSLCLLDEFGGGTDNLSGAALLATALGELLDKGDECPKTLVATHFAALHRVQGVLESSALLRFAHMNVRITNENAFDEPVFLYELVSGCAEGSFGLACARRAGVPGEIVSRAATIVHELREGRKIKVRQEERMSNS